MPPLLSAHQLSKHFGHGHTLVKAVDNISLEVESGQIVLIMGPSGSGKTTLLSMLGGLLQPDTGSILFAGDDLCQMSEAKRIQFRARQVGFVFQSFNLLDALSVEENILFPASLSPGTRHAKRQRAETLMQALGISARRRALPRTLSGGEKQRVAIARALINQPPLLLADEPTGNLDSQSGQEVMMILHDIARDQNCAVIVVTHDPRVEEIADRIFWLEDGTLRVRRSEQHHWARDPVCGMRVDAWTAVHRAQAEDQEFVFCSANCRQRFLADPSRYSASG
ncbi:MAG: ATP-binding cassette domain-containing protein [Hahellaceae bacterium]|nr:ATP-binding cassette domain-containing protein [Hahellaceae bacterium]MCP5168368.1 ATP-binding cassette domain-containing protein [Hahellaceae bacterium]